MKILLTGHSGQLGHELLPALQHLGEVVAVSRAQMDLADLNQIRDVIRREQPQLIINPAAYTAVDHAETERELAFCINAEAPRIMAEEAQRLGAGLIHYSTDYVFDGRATTPYRETDITHPINAYGESKLAGEQAIANACEAYWIFRTSWVYSSHGNSFLKTIIRLAGERDTLNIVSDQIGAPTWTKEISDITCQLLSKNNDEKLTLLRNTSGLYHLSASGETSWYHYARHIVAELIRLQQPTRLAVDAISPIASTDWPTPAPRPANSRLALDKLAQTFHIRPAPWQTSVTACLQQMFPQ